MEIMRVLERANHAVRYFAIHNPVFFVVFRNKIAYSLQPNLIPFVKWKVYSFDKLPVLWIPSRLLLVNDRHHCASTHEDIVWCEIAMSKSNAVVVAHARADVCKDIIA